MNESLSELAPALGNTEVNPFPYAPERIPYADSLGRTKYIQDLIGEAYQIHLGVDPNNAERSIKCDIFYPHIVQILGRRGSFKSHEASIMVAAMAVFPHLTVIVPDTVGNFPRLFSSLGVPFTIVQPIGVGKSARLSQGTYGLSIGFDEVAADDWINIFGQEKFSPQHLLFQEVELKQPRSFDQAIHILEADSKLTSSKEGFLRNTVRAVKSRLISASSFQCFQSASRSLSLRDIVRSKGILIVDVSDGAVSEAEQNLIIGLLARKALMYSKSQSRADGSAGDSRHHLSLVIDEIQKIFSSEGAAFSKRALGAYAKEGRNYGLGLIYACQRPSGVPVEISSQSDISIVNALGHEEDISGVVRHFPADLRTEVSSLLRSVPTGRAIIHDQLRPSQYVSLQFDVSSFKLGKIWSRVHEEVPRARKQKDVTVPPNPVEASLCPTSDEDGQTKVEKIYLRPVMEPRRAIMRSLSFSDRVRLFFGVKRMTVSGIYYRPIYLFELRKTKGALYRLLGLNFYIAVDAVDGTSVIFPRGKMCHIPNSKVSLLLALALKDPGQFQRVLSGVDNKGTLDFRFNKVFRLATDDGKVRESTNGWLIRTGDRLITSLNRPRPVSEARSYIQRHLYTEPHRNRNGRIMSTRISIDSCLQLLTQLYGCYRPVKVQTVLIPGILNEDKWIRMIH